MGNAGVVVGHGNSDHSKYLHRDQGFCMVIANVASGAHDELLAKYLEKLLAEQYPEEEQPSSSNEVPENSESAAKEVEIDENVMFEDQDQMDLFTRIHAFEDPDDIPDYFLFGRSELRIATFEEIYRVFTLDAFYPHAWWFLELHFMRIKCA